MDEGPEEPERFIGQRSGTADRASLLLQVLEEKILGGEVLLDGIVVDEDVAKITPCQCFPVDEKTEICFSPGVVGSLSKAQKGDVGKPGPLCPTKVYKESPGVRSRVKGFRACAALNKGKPIQEFLKGMSECLEQRKIEV